MSLESLRQICDAVKRGTKNSVIALFAVQDDKVSIVVALTNDLGNSKLHAGKIAKQLSEICEGSVGGRKDLAQGGGKNPKGVQEAIKKLIELAK